LLHVLGSRRRAEKKTTSFGHDDLYFNLKGVVDRRLAVSQGCDGPLLGVQAESFFLRGDRLLMVGIFGLWYRAGRASGKTR
jgi:hypothetical protein